MSLPYKTLSFITLCLAVCAVSSTVLNRTSGTGGLTDRREPREVENVILCVGYLNPEDVLYYEYSHSEVAIPNEYVTHQVTFFSNDSGNMTYIVAYEEGESHNATASITLGGINDYLVNILLRSDLGRGYNITFLIYGSPY